MNLLLPKLIFWAGLAQLSVLTASTLVPIRLNWKRDLQVLPRLHRQLYWVYGGYVVLAIVALGLISLINAQELAEGSLLARCICGYMAAFWGIRLAIQSFLEVNTYLTSWWLIAGYHTLTLLFASFTALFTFTALRP